jgi:hypothetical protein
VGEKVQPSDDLFFAGIRNAVIVSRDITAKKFSSLLFFLDPIPYRAILFLWADPTKECSNVPQPL